ncbi:hypothetical protein L210DRAFT_989097, partial [Boletus edulis BED1]
MGSGSSRPATSYPFPVPGNDPMFPFKSVKWSRSTKKKSNKDKDHGKLDDFIVAKPPPPTATYGYPYCSSSPAASVPVFTIDRPADPQMQQMPQMPSAFPAYYAPVQMALVHPFVQQPVLAMPQAYGVPMAYQTTAAPVQPAVAPALTTQPASAMQMPVPAPAPAPAPAPPFSSAPPPRAPTQMPQPHPAPP